MFTQAQFALLTTQHVEVDRPDITFTLPNPRIRIPLGPNLNDRRWRLPTTPILFLLIFSQFE
jgi:hypothetical protein